MTMRVCCRLVVGIQGFADHTTETFVVFFLRALTKSGSWKVPVSLALTLHHCAEEEDSWLRGPFQRDMGVEYWITSPDDVRFRQTWTVKLPSVFNAPLGKNVMKPWTQKKVSSKLRHRKVLHRQLGPAHRKFLTRTGPQTRRLACNNVPVCNLKRQFAGLLPLGAIVSSNTVFHCPSSSSPLAVPHK